MMGKLTVEIGIEPVWLEEPTDLSHCATCEDTIYGDMYRLWIMPYTDNIRLLGKATDVVICKSCLDMIELKMDKE